MPILTTNNTSTSITIDSIVSRIQPLNYELSALVSPQMIAMKTLQRLPDSISEDGLDEIAAGIAATMSNLHPDYALIGGRILISKLHRQLQVDSISFAQNISRLYNYKINGFKSNRISTRVFEFITNNEQKLQEIINYDRDYELDYSAVSSFLKRGLEKIDNMVAETPAQLFMRVACGLNVWSPRSETELNEFEQHIGWKPTFGRMSEMSDEERLINIKEYFEVLSKRQLSVPGPILMHAGSETNQMASCFLEYCSDSLTGDDYHYNGQVGGIMKAVTQLAAQSKGGAGTAIALHDIRARGSHIMKTNGKSNGILPFMKMFDATIGAIDQSGKRAGVCTVYLEPWHKDILDFLDAADHFTVEEKRCKHLFFALWTNDLFFERLTNDKADARWILFDPAIVLQYIDKPLSDYYGQEFKEKYNYLESLNIGQSISLMEIWSRVCKLMQISGVPYIVNKDQINIKSNQKNIGTIRSSNVCTEIALASNNDETAVCVLSSICLSRAYNPNKMDGIDYKQIIETARVATRHLNNVIDLQYYPTPETRNACLRRRAIGIGTQGLADLFALLKLDFTSDQAKLINKRIYEVVYYGCLLESMELAKIEGSYDGFAGSPVSNGVLQYDMWNIDESTLFLNNEGRDLVGVSNAWQELKSNIKQFGLRNSEVTALAPTASASIRMSNNETFEPFTRNIYVRQFIGGSVQILNQYMVYDLLELGLWSEELSDQIVSHDGSLKNIPSIPQHIKDRYQTAYELNFRDLIDMMVDRSPFVSQTSSFNHYISYADAGPTAFTQRIIYGWKKGLKTLSYYMHTETSTTGKKELGGISSNINLAPKLSAVLEPISSIASEPKVFADGTVCNMEEGCEACSS